MSKKFDWRRAKLSSQPSRTLKDEREYRDNDAAARWLAKHELAERMRKAGFRPRKAKVK